MNSPLCDYEIAEMAEKYDMITPFIGERRQKPGRLSYGLSPASYEVRMKPKMKLFLPSDKIIDPLDRSTFSYEEVEGDEIIMPPHSFGLTVTLEYFKIPKNIMCICIGKSTYARCGIVLNVTGMDNGVEAEIVLELSNTSPCPVKIYTGEDSGICKFIFFKTSECGIPYDGNYQKQTGITLPTSKI